MMDLLALLERQNAYIEAGLPFDTALEWAKIDMGLTQNREIEADLKEFLQGEA